MKPTPVTRQERFLDKLGEEQTLTAVTNEEKFLKKIGNPEQTVPTPVTEYEKYLYKIGGGEIDVPTPANKNGLKAFLWRACGNEVELPTPVTREEMYWDEYIKKYIEVKTLTGALPLTFTTSETALRSWTLHGADFEKIVETEDTLPLTFTAKGGNAVDWTISGNAEGIGERTKNILDISSFDNIDQNNVVMILNDDNATISAYTTDTPTAQVQGLCNFMVEKTGNYLLSGIPEDAPNIALNVYIWNRDTNSRAKAWDKVTDMGTCNKNSQSVEVYLEQDVRYQLRVRVQTSYGKYEEPVIVSPMIRFDGTTDSFIPFGYQIPITISQDGESDKSYDIFIGDAPLGEGETVSKTSTDIDIELFEGENTVSTTLTNKPDASITYTDYLGVGEYVDGQWQIPVFVSGGKRYFDWITDSYSHSQYGLTVTGDANHRLHITGAVGNTGSDNKLILKTMTIEMALPVGVYIFRGVPNYEETGFFLDGGLFHATPEWYTDKGNGSRFTKTDYSQTFLTMYLYFDREKVEGVQQDFYITPVVESVKTYDIPIDAPLREGQSITDTIDIETFTGENTIDSTLTNKPAMTIKYKE